MADVNVLEQGTYPAEPMIKSFFRKLPTDLRFIQTEYRQFNSQTGVDKNSTNFSFVLNRLDAPYCYLLEDSLIKVNLVITKSDGITLPDADKTVAPINNVCGSLFEDVRMKINDDELTQNGEFYPYKCYLKRLITYSQPVKSTQFVAQGYYEDSVTDNDDIEPQNSNNGWKQRCSWFREGIESLNAPYRAGGAHFISTFDHDLTYIGKAMPPGTKISFNLTRSSDDFFLMKDPSDTEKYRAIVLNCVLFVKVAKMSDAIFRELETSFTKQPILYQFRKFIAKEINIPVLSREFITGNLFPDSEIPCKLHFVIVHSNSKCGDQTTNPFTFLRKFTIKKDEIDKSGNLAVEIDQTCMYAKLRDMHKQNQTLQIQLVDALSLLHQTLNKISAPERTEPIVPQTVATEGSSTGVTTRASSGNNNF
jgi:hypothetical protein